MSALLITKFAPSERQIDSLVCELKHAAFKYPHECKKIAAIIESLEKEGMSSLIEVTDEDNEQLCINVCGNAWIYSQRDSGGDYYSDTLDLEEQSSDKISNAVESFGYNLDSLKEDDSESWKQLAVECVFELEAFSCQ